VRVARVAILRVLAGEAVGAFVHAGGGDENRAGGLESTDGEGIRRRGRVGGEGGAAGARHAAGDVEEVLGRERNALERPDGRTGGPGRVERQGAGAGADGVKGRHGIQRSGDVERGEGRLDAFGGTHPSGGDSGGNTACVPRQAGASFGVKTGAGASPASPGAAATSRAKPAVRARFAATSATASSGRGRPTAAAAARA
jgi:hypothetical protein